MPRFLIFIFVLLGCTPGSVLVARAWGENAAVWPGYVASPWFEEQTREICFSPETRAIIVAPVPSHFDPNRPTLLVVYATPNGNSVEQTLGCAAVEGLDWHFDIQHAAAQTRMYRESEQNRNVVLACIQADSLSWPAWKAKHENSSAIVKRIVDSLRLSIPGKEVQVVLTGHSGGGRFMFEFIDAVDEIPAYVERIAFLDANYGYNNELQHGEKILQWLKADATRRFIVLAYDDRNIILNGKKVVGPTGGTYRASYRMIDSLRSHVELEESKLGEFDRLTAMDGRLATLIHPNPENKILHTRLVGEMNGLSYVLTLGGSNKAQAGQLNGPRNYTEWVQPSPYEPARWHSIAPVISPRSGTMESGELVAKLQELSLGEREQQVIDEAARGNVPDFLSQFIDVSTQATGADGVEHEIVFRVSPDYFSVGTDKDFLRVPLTPRTAQHIADLYGCVLPTRKMVDVIYRQAATKLAPQPMTEDRESLATFHQHHRMIENQRSEKDRLQLVAGIKKDVVITNRLMERPNRVAIYGWHKVDGTPIQPLTTVHIESYVDYSHGIRLVDRWATADGTPMLIQDVLRDETLCELLSDEGPIQRSKY